MTAYAKIRAALELSGNCLTDEALAALAELEKSAAPTFEPLEVTDEVATRVCFAEMGISPTQSWPAIRGRAMIAAVQAELGPTLGLVPLREPTPEECLRIQDEYQNGKHGAFAGRAMFRAVRAVMGGES